MFSLNPAKIQQPPTSPGLATNFTSQIGRYHIPNLSTSRRYPGKKIKHIEKTSANIYGEGL